MPSPVQAGQGGLKGQLGPHLAGLAGCVVGHHLQFPPRVLGHTPRKTNLRPWLMYEDFIGDCDSPTGEKMQTWEETMFPIGHHYSQLVALSHRFF